MDEAPAPESPRRRPLYNLPLGSVITSVAAYLIRPGAAVFFSRCGNRAGKRLARQQGSPGSF